MKKKLLIVSHALELGGDLLVTGPTGTNVNDLTVILTDY